VLECGGKGGDCRGELAPEAAASTIALRHELHRN